MNNLLLFILGIPNFVWWIASILIIGFFVINFMLGPHFKREKTVKEKRKSARQIHGEIAQKILEDPKLVERYFGSSKNCTRNASRNS